MLPGQIPPTNESTTNNIKQPFLRSNKFSQREARLADKMERSAWIRKNETILQREARLAENRERVAKLRQNKTVQQREARRGMLCTPLNKYFINILY